MISLLAISFSQARDHFPCLEEMPEVAAYVLRGTHVLVQTENSKVMHYLNRAGRSRSRNLGDYSVVSELEDNGPYSGPGKG